MNKVISFALWGNIPQYTLGALKNVELAKKIYPDWKCRFYTDSTTSMVTLRDLHANGADVYQVKNEFGSWGGLFWRFYVVDDPSVDAFIIRDCDSRLSLREKSAVDQWLFSPFCFHSMKDHPWHSGVPILGGMWGAKRGCLKDMQQKITKWMPSSIMTKGPDQLFIKNIIYPLVKNNWLEHDGVKITGDTNPKALDFPTPRINGEFVGEIYDENDIPNQEHREILKKYEHR